MRLSNFPLKLFNPLVAEFDDGTTSLAQQVVMVFVTQDVFIKLVSFAGVEFAKKASLHHEGQGSIDRGPRRPSTVPHGPGEQIIGAEMFVGAPGKAQNLPSWCRHPQSFLAQEPVKFPAGDFQLQVVCSRAAADATAPMSVRRWAPSKEISSAAT